MTEEILRKFLLKIVKKLNFLDYDLKIEPVSSGGANYTATLYNVTVTEGEREVHMFGKIAAIGEKMRSHGSKFYETENFAYSKLLKIYEQLEEEHKVPQEHRLIFPKFYGYNSNTYEETIVLENLVMSGYQTYDRFKIFDWEYAKSAVSSLAKMHALAFAYGEYYPEEFNNIVKGFKYKLDMTNNGKLAYLESMMRKTVHVIREENRDKFQKFFESFTVENIPDLFQWSRKPVICHGDYKPSNLMHKICEDGSIEIKIVDLQTLQSASPIVDLLYFLYTGSDEKFRAKYYNKLLDHYYTELHTAMSRLHLKPEDIYSREDFDYELEKKLPLGLAIAVFALPIVTVDTDVAPKVNEDLDLSAFSKQKITDLYTERLNGIVNDYVKFGVLI